MVFIIYLIACGYIGWYTADIAYEYKRPGLAVLFAICSFAIAVTFKSYFS